MSAEPPGDGRFFFMRNSCINIQHDTREPDAGVMLHSKVRGKGVSCMGRENLNKGIL